MSSPTDYASDPAALAAAAYATGTVGAPGGPIAPTNIQTEIPAPIMSTPPGSVSVVGNVMQSISSWWNTSVLNPIHDASSIQTAISNAAGATGAAVTAATSTLTQWLTLAAVILGIYLALRIWGDTHR